MKDFKIVEQFPGYRNKADQTKMPAGVLVSGSQNVLTNDGDKVTPRNGYELDGAEDATVQAVKASVEFETSRGDEIPMRAHTSQLEIRQTLDTSAPTWVVLETSIDADINFLEQGGYWDTTEGQNAMLFVNESSNIYYWSGGMTTYASATSNTITKEGTTSWGEEGFLTAGTRTVRLRDDSGTWQEYTYSGGESTTTLTGVSPDPTSSSFTAGTLAIQKVRVTANSSITGLPNTFENKTISVMNNQIWVGAGNSNSVYVSKINDYTDFSFSSPRTPAEGALINLNAPDPKFIVQEGTDNDEYMYISAGKNQWYQSVLKTSADLTKEELFIKRLKTSPQQGALVQSSIAKLKNSIVYISHEPTLESLGRIENINSPQNLPLSDPIKEDFKNLTFTNAHMKLYKSNLYIALPSESKVLIYNIEKGWWEAPQTLPVRRFAIISDDLYGHSNANPETYKLFTGTSDRVVSGVGVSINAIAKFAYMNYGKRAWQKRFDEWFTEAKMSSNTNLDVQLNYDWTSSTALKKWELKGNTEALRFENKVDGSLGKNKLAAQKIGGDGDSDLDKFRQKHPLAETDFYEIQPVYSTNDTDQQWEILAFGPNVKDSKNDNPLIKQ